MTRRDFSDVGRGVVRSLLGKFPTRERYDEDRGRVVERLSSDLPWRPGSWADELEGAEFLYCYFARRLAEGATREDIHRELQTGMVVVVAISATGAAKEIAPERWRGQGRSMLLWFARDGHGHEPNLYVLEASGAKSRPADDARDGAAFANVRQTAKAESDCRHWLVEQMRKSPHSRPKPRAQFERDALMSFPGLSRRAFERGWDSAVAETLAFTWKKPGRPRKNPAPEIPAPD